MESNRFVIILSLSSLLLSCTAHAIPLGRLASFLPIIDAPAPAPAVAVAPVPSPTYNDASISPDILKICTGSENPELCTKTISRHMYGGPFEPLRALEIEVTATVDLATNIIATIDNCLKDPTTNKKAISALGICKTEYKDMMDTFKEVVSLIAEQNVVDAYYKFSSVISYHSACEDAFLESPGVQLPFPEDSRTIFQLAGNTIAIMDAIVNNHRV